MYIEKEYNKKYLLIILSFYMVFDSYNILVDRKRMLVLQIDLDADLQMKLLHFQNIVLCFGQ